MEQEHVVNEVTKEQTKNGRLMIGLCLAVVVILGQLWVITVMANKPPVIMHQSKEGWEQYRPESRAQHAASLAKETLSLLHNYDFLTIEKNYELAMENFEPDFSMRNRSVLAAQISRIKEQEMVSSFERNLKVPIKVDYTNGVWTMYVSGKLHEKATGDTQRLANVTYAVKLAPIEWSKRYVFAMAIIDVEQVDEKPIKESSSE